MPDICCRHYAVVTLRQAMAAPRTLAGMPASRMGRAPGRAWAAPAGSDHPDPHPHAIPAAAGCAVPRSRHPLRHRKGIPSASTARIGVAPPRTWASGVAAAHPPSTQERGLHGRIRLPRDRGWGEATRPRHEFVHGRVHRRHNFHLSADARAFHLLIDAAQRAGRSGGDGFSFGSLRAGVAVDGLRRRVSFKTGCSHSASAGEWRPSTLSRPSHPKRAAAQGIAGCPLSTLRRSVRANPAIAAGSVRTMLRRAVSGSGNPLRSVVLVVANRPVVTDARADRFLVHDDGIIVARMIADAAIVVNNARECATAETVAGTVPDAIATPLSGIEARPVVVTRAVADHATARRRFNNVAVLIYAHEALLPHEFTCLGSAAGVVADHAATRCTDRHARRIIIAGVAADPAAAPFGASAGSRRQAGRVADIDIAGVVADDAVTFRACKLAGEGTIAGVVADDAATPEFSEVGARLLPVTRAIAYPCAVSEGCTRTYYIARLIPNHHSVARGVEAAVGGDGP